MAGLYRRLGYRDVAFVENYVGPFHRRILIKTLVDSAGGGYTDVRGEVLNGNGACDPCSPTQAFLPD